MLYPEFINRTHVEVTAEEYVVIEEMYYNSDADKDTFCSMWCKINAGRVKAAKAAEKAREEKARTIEKLYQVLERVEADATNPVRRDEPAAIFLSNAQIRLLEGQGIEMSEEKYDYFFGCNYTWNLRPSALAYSVKEHIRKLIKAA